VDAPVMNLEWQSRLNEFSQFCTFEGLTLRILWTSGVEIFVLLRSDPDEFPGLMSAVPVVDSSARSASDRVVVLVPLLDHDGCFLHTIEIFSLNITLRSNPFKDS
jgi:hypothetical protein